MTPRRFIGVAVGLALAAAAQAGADARGPAAFGWLAQLAGHCWQAENPHASGKVEACWSFDANTQSLRLRTRDATGATVRSIVRLQRGALHFQAVGHAGAPAQECWLMPASFDAYGSTPRSGALECHVADPRSTMAPPASWTYRLEPVAHDRYRIVETYQYGGGAQAFRRHVWLFVRGGAAAAQPDGDGTDDASDAGCDGGVATPAMAPRESA